MSGPKQRCSHCLSVVDFRVGLMFVVASDAGGEVTGDNMSKWNVLKAIHAVKPPVGIVVARRWRASRHQPSATKIEARPTKTAIASSRNLHIKPRYGHLERRSFGVDPAATRIRFVGDECQHRVRSDGILISQIARKRAGQLILSRFRPSYEGASIVH